MPHRPATDDILDTIGDGALTLHEVERRVVLSDGPLHVDNRRWLIRAAFDDLKRTRRIRPSGGQLRGPGTRWRRA